MSVIRRDVAFVPSRARPGSWLHRQRLGYWLSARRPVPSTRVIRPVDEARLWTLLFVFLPDGSLSGPQRFTLSQVKALKRRMCVVCAAPDPDSIPDDIKHLSDALYWKGLEGYDFSGYTIGLNAIARHSEGADVFVLNDSIFGPFEGISDFLDRAPWEFTGFSASHQVENHVQSYAFVIRSLTGARLSRLASVFPTSYCYNDIVPVVMNLETRLARVAARTMTVGSYFFGPDDGTDPSISHGIALASAGLPFLKRALLGKHRDKVDVEQVKNKLLDLGFPPDDL